MDSIHSSANMVSVGYSQVKSQVFFFLFFFLVGRTPTLRPIDLRPRPEQEQVGGSRIGCCETQIGHANYSPKRKVIFYFNKDRPLQEISTFFVCNFRSQSKKNSSMQASPQAVEGLAQLWLDYTIRPNTILINVGLEYSLQVRSSTNFVHRP